MFPDLDVAAARLAPGATATATYVVSQGDADAGEVVNTAAATGTYMDVEARAGDGHTIAIVPGPVLAGAGIDSSVTVTNAGNVTLDDVTVDDPLVGDVTVAPTSLAPGAEATGTTTYAITQAEIDAGARHSTATATATAPDGTTTTHRDSITRPLPQPRPDAEPGPSPGPGAAPPSEPDRPVVERAAGPDRVTTAVAVSCRAHPAGAPVVVLATAGGYADALAGGAVAGQLGGPVLLTPSNGLALDPARESRDWLDRNRGRIARVTLAGGPSAVSANTSQDIRALLGAE